MPYEESGRKFLPFEGAFFPLVNSWEQDTDYKRLLIPKGRTVPGGPGVADRTSVVRPSFQMARTRIQCERPPLDRWISQNIQLVDYENAHIRKHRLIADGDYVVPPKARTAIQSDCMI